ncbi:MULTISPECIES: efflux RND transporter periplasmic adaptor subunit [unclassified Carboxylicivirga]|uniref:efflux RND transporter periplasmic adaptor subunit n=1 Tax=Carboxylicivirga TaxID=1628153 RepID=UPI003D33C817
MKRIIIKSALFTSLTLTVLACSSPGGQSNEEAGNQSEFIQLTKQQYAMEKMEIAAPTQMLFKSGISANGYICAQPNGVAQINTILPGRVEAVYVTLGQKVRKGEKLALISSAQLIDWQQQYLRAIALKKKLTADYNRSKALYGYNIGSEKEFLMVESEYRLVVADYNALSLQLQRLNLDLESIGAGNIVDSYFLTSPIEGELTQLNLMIGDGIEVQENIAEVVDAKSLQLSLSVYERDMPLVKTGSPVVFQVVNRDNEMFTGQLTAVARRVQEHSKAIECRASIKPEDMQEFVYKSYVKAQIITRQKEALGLPEEALVKQEDDSYYFVVKKQESQLYFLEKKKAIVGDSYNGFVEVQNALPNEQVITSGVYNLQVD